MELFRTVVEKTQPLEIVCSYLELDDSFLNLLFKALDSTVPIELLDLEGNHITDQGVKEFANFLVRGPAVSHINLTFNLITVEGAWLLTKKLFKCYISDSKYIVKHIDLSRNKIYGRSELYLKSWEYLKIYKEKALGPVLLDRKMLSFFPQYSKFSLSIKEVSESLYGIREVKILCGTIDRIRILETTPAEILPNFLKSKANSIKQYIGSFGAPNSLHSKQGNKPGVLAHDDSVNISDLLQNRPSFPITSIEQLLKNGHNINEIDPRLDESLLMHAARSNKVKLTQYLIGKGANPNVKNVIHT